MLYRLHAKLLFVSQTGYRFSSRYSIGLTINISVSDSRFSYKRSILPKNFLEFPCLISLQLLKKNLEKRSYSCVYIIGQFGIMKQFKERSDYRGRESDSNENA